MMLRRKMMAELIRWRESGPEKKCLMIRGARQVGKTYLVREFGKSYTNYIELNFIEHPEYSNIFSGSLDVDTMRLNISALFPSAVFTPGETLILLDEIQESPEALTSLKFWTLDHRYDVIATGSTLGIDYKTSFSFPVGHVKTLEMTSLDFEEFLWAKGMKEEVIEQVRTCFQNREAVPSVIHDRMMQLMKEYLITGGMPEVVKHFLASNNLASMDEIQRQIYADNIDNIAHYAPSQIRMRTQKCYRSIPAQLSKENHKFQYKIVEQGGTSTRFETCLDWLEKAYLILPVHHVSAIGFPLDSFHEEGTFRIYPTDIGMLIAAYPFLVKGALWENENLEDQPRNLIVGQAKGGIYEALAADMLYKRGYRDLFYLKDQKSTREVEFFITNQDGIIPVEIKAGRNRANSLGHLLENPMIPYGYKLSSQNVGVSGKRITLPLYMLMFL
ncbi:MAG: ATP-binding protein [Clostridia bacterium]|nr:ATP-binding protein [Clostridia bacterium]